MSMRDAECVTRIWVLESSRLFQIRCISAQKTDAIKNTDCFAAYFYLVVLFIAK